MTSQQLVLRIDNHLGVTNDMLEDNPVETMRLAKGVRDAYHKLSPDMVMHIGMTEDFIQIRWPHDDEQILTDLFWKAKTLSNQRVWRVRSLRIELV